MRYFNEKRELVEDDNSEFWNDLEYMVSADRMVHDELQEGVGDDRTNRTVTWNEWWRN